MDPKKYYVLEAGMTPSDVFDVDRKSIVIIGGVLRCTFGFSERSQSHDVDAVDFAEWLESLFLNNDIRSSVSMASSVDHVPETDKENRIIVVSPHDLMAVRQGLKKADNVVTARNLLQNISVKCDIGIFWQECIGVIYERHFHSDKAIEMRGGKKLSFEGVVKRKINLE